MMAPDGANAANVADATDANDASSDSGAIEGDAHEAAACPPGLVSANELAATPRANVNLELLALALTPGRFVANDAIYQRLVRDIGAIRTKQPEVAAISYSPRHDGRSLILELPRATVEQMKAGTYHAWDCLNATYGATLPIELGDIGTASSIFRKLEVEGIYATDLLATEYKKVPGIADAQTNIFVGGGPTICVTGGPSIWHYVFDAASGDCPAGCTEHTYRHFTADADGAVTVLETWTSQATEPPAWVTEYASRADCLR